MRKITQKNNNTEDLNILSEEKETANLLHRWNQVNGLQTRDGLPSFIDVLHNWKEENKRLQS